MTAVIAQKYGLKFDINFCNNSSSRLPFCLKIWSLLTLFKTNIRWILFSSLIIYLFILIKWVLISLGKQTLRWYMRHGIYLCHHLEIQILLIVSWLVAMQTVLHVKKEHRDRERERETMWNGSFGLVSWLVRTETGRLKALNSTGAQTLNRNSMPSFGNQTKPFSKEKTSTFHLHAYGSI